MESASYRRPFFLELFARWLRDAYRANQVPFLSGILTGLLAHGYAFANKLVSYDEVGSLFNKGVTTSSGRWGLDVLSLIFPDFSMPWFYGLLSIFLFTLAACILVRVFAIRSRVLQALVVGSILAFPSLTATVIYLYTLSSYAVSFLLAAIAIWLLQKKTWLACLAAIACMVFSLGIYQAYISIPAAFLVLLLIQDLLQGAAFWPTVKKGCYFLAFLIFSLLGYLLVTRIVNACAGLTLNSYANQRITFSLSYLPTGILEGYKAFVWFFSGGLWGLIPVPVSQLIHVACLLAAGILLLLWLLQKRRPAAELALLAALLLIFPLAVNCMYLFVSADPALCAIHTLVLYGFVAVYMFAAVVAQACDLPELFAGRKGWIAQAAQNILLLGLLVCIPINAYVSNSVYLSLQLRYENAYAFYSTVLSDLHQNPDYDQDTKLALMGEYPDPGFYWDELEHVYQIMGADGFQPDSHSNWFFLYYYMGQRVPFATQEQKEQIAASEEFAQMPVYPYHGSMRMFDNVMVVKLSQ